MATYSTRNRLIKQANNENLNTWGATFNVSMTDMVDEAMDGITSLSMSGDATLTDEDGATDQSRKRILNITSTGGANRTITIPAVEKWYLVRNAGVNLVTIKTAAGAGVVVPPSVSAVVFCDGTVSYRIAQSGYGLITSGSFTIGEVNETLTLTGYNYNSFMIVIEGLSMNGGSGTICPRFSTDNSTYTTDGISIASYSAAADAFYGNIEITNAGADAGKVVSGLGNLTSNNTAVAGAQTIAWRVTGGVKYVRLHITGTGTIDAGTYEIYGL